MLWEGCPGCSGNRGDGFLKFEARGAAADQTL